MLVVKACGGMPSMNSRTRYLYLQKTEEKRRDHGLMESGTPKWCSTPSVVGENDHESVRMEQIDAKRRGRHPPGRAAASSMPGQRLERHAQAVPQQRPSRRFGQQQCAHAQSSAAYASASGSSQRLPQAASIAAGGSRGAAGEVEGAAISGSATTGEAAGSRGASWAVAEGLGQRAKRSAARERADARGCRGTGAADGECSSLAGDGKLKRGGRRRGEGGGCESACGGGHGSGTAEPHGQSALDRRSAESNLMV